MAYQFVHIEVYARSPSRLTGSRRAVAGQKRAKGTGGWSARQVLAEALREDGAFPHVESVKAPDVVLGDLHGLAHELDQLDADPPRGTRKDTPILMAGVLSAPWSPGDPRSTEWRLDAIEWLKREWGDNLRCVVAHDDEPWDHLHFFVTTAQWTNVKELHPGAAARRAASSEGLAPKLQKEAFSDAMRAFQDRYHSDVGAPHGMARIGPGRRRLSRVEWLQEQQQAAALAVVSREARDLKESSRREADAVIARGKRAAEQMIESAQRAVRIASTQIVEQKNEVAAQAAALAKESERLASERKKIQQLTEALSVDELHRAAKRLDEIVKKDARPKVEPDPRPLDDQAGPAPHPDSEGATRALHRSRPLK